jgi:hypothetical protein
MKILNHTFAAAALCLLAASAGAHDPSQFDQMTPIPAPLPVPTTCDELADTDNYSSDETNERIKVLKQRCDERKADAADGNQAKAADEEEPASDGDE